MNGSLTYIKQLLTSNKRPQINYKVHLIAWSIFIFYESFAVWLATGIKGHVLSYALHYALNIGIFYIHALFILPLAFRKPKQFIWRVPVLTAIEILLYIFASYQIDYFLAHFTTAIEIEDLKINNWFVFGSLWRGIYFIGFASGYYFLNNYLKERTAKAQLEKQAMEQVLKEKDTAIELSNAKNAYLQAQINPHFLFNTLNFIYSQTHKTQPAAAKAIILLTNIMRYAIQTDQGVAMIPLEKELEQVRHLIDLWQIRKKQVLNIKLEYDESCKTVLFIPLVLLTLTENIYKHGDLTEPLAPAQITISFQKDILIINTHNFINTGLKPPGFNSGLENIRLRLFHTYGDKAKLKYGQEPDNYFKVTVTVLK
ncbi:sensor histidine kinase [Pedobacter sp. PLR]|uniref:sensor histidine kinase n=1 Tax=Pedobacter sp. PLR TaxID=2994465 RepID=UPI0022452B78|nr:sensor histidine kinase [Pedobacter sp. PLR]MCX2450062.1 sensor histidine kinase [Pedobacter sp. PLR]